jgi:hypothetical protein
MFFKVAGRKDETAAMFFKTAGRKDETAGCST